MAELVNLGEHCSWPSCHRLDFLPIGCFHCKENFCSDHSSLDNHNCPNQPNNDVLYPSSVPAPTTYSCSVIDCKKREQVSIKCPHCNVQVCLGHRHQQEHHCSKYIAPTKSMAATKAAVDNIVNRETQAPPKKKKMSKAAQKTAAKVQLMKLKQKSVGVAGLPMEERLYFMVENPAGKCVGCWVSSTWSFGRVVDCLADFTGTVNNNNVAGEKKLWLFKSSDRQPLCDDPETIIGEIVKNEVVFNGDSVLLGYKEEE